VPSACKELAVIVCQDHSLVHGVERLRATTVLQLLHRAGALRRVERLEALLLACICDARGRLGREDAPYPQADRLRTALAALGGVNASAIAQDSRSPKHIAEHLYRARIRAIQQAFRHFDVAPAASSASS
jgi:tRNA nucleotidyltransferase (CCA-adding enzyme)